MSKRMDSTYGYNFDQSMLGTTHALQGISGNNSISKSVQPQRFVAAGQSRENRDDSRLRRAPPYSIFALIYDKAMSEAVLPSLIDAFDHSRKKHDVSTESIADIGCGTGRFLKYLTRFGGRLTAVDNSPAMLRLARRRLTGANVTVLRDRMQDFELPNRVDTLTCTFDTINYLLTPDDVGRTFAAFARAIKPGGRLLFDFIPQGAAATATEGRQYIRIGKILSEWRIQIDPEGRGSVVTILMRRAGEDNAPVYVERHRQCWHAPDDVRAALAHAGFGLMDWRPAEPGGTMGWVHVVARRRAEVAT